jgi:CubicO group peptidase (beta-lactamase class C family)
MHRRELLGLGISIGTLAAGSRVVASDAQAALAGPYSRCFGPLDQFVAQYLHDMNAPGLTLSLADANGVQRVCAYGVEDLQRCTPLSADRLFHIGSISKSFLALCLLQLRDEGRFDLHRPLNEYLPWLRIDGFDRPLTAHDLMTHAAALPDGPLFPADPAFRYRATAAPIASTQAAGCIASTARDMGKYLQLLINRGEHARQRLVSQEGFALFTHPHIAADEFGPGSSYGYAVAVDKLDGHARLKHTGGMVSFASALQVDLDAGVGVFASINAMQGYRPTPVAEYALRLMRACREGVALPPLPAAIPAIRIASASDYAGIYTGLAGRQLKIIAEGDRLYLEHRGMRVPLEAAIDPDYAFIVQHEDYAHFPLLFTRGGVDGKGPVTEAGWGEDWYAAPAYQGPRAFATPAEWSRYTGHYRSEDPWIGSVRVVSRRGKLWMNGVTPLAPVGENRFYLRDEPASPEWLGFSDFVDGRAMQLQFSGNALQRV